ncbi:MAG: hypothetical protein ACJAQZ_000234 [Planctomycetota bacterium]|jgi:hypothetical protein
MAAQSADADAINTPGAWANAGPTLSLGPGNVLLEESTAVLFPPVTAQSRDLQLIIGGSRQTASHSSTAVVTNECWAMFTRNTPPVWLPFPPMIHPRKFANSVMLPDASILVVGGGTHNGHGVAGHGQLEAEVFYNGNWVRLSDQYGERTYHSQAILLDDGRVLSCGGDTCPNDAEYEIFEPHYLDGAPLRPAFAGTPPTSLTYGQTAQFDYSVPFGQSIDRVVLLRPGSVTHSFDSGQRYEPLAFKMVSPGNSDQVALEVSAPANPTVFPPGHAMMFLLSSTGVPSVAHWVHVMP